MKQRDWKGSLSRLAWSLAQASVMADPLAYGAYLHAVSDQEGEVSPSPALSGIALGLRSCPSSISVTGRRASISPWSISHE
jgi:hypothetical protein